MTNDELSKLNKKLEDIQMAVAEIRVIYDAHSKRLGRMEDTIFGNGKAGLNTQIRAMLWIASWSLGFLALIVANIVAMWIK